MAFTGNSAAPRPGPPTELATATLAGHCHTGSRDRRPPGPLPRPSWPHGRPQRAGGDTTATGHSDSVLRRRYRAASGGGRCGGPKLPPLTEYANVQRPEP